MIELFDHYDGVIYPGVGASTYGARRQFLVQVIMSFYFYGVIYFTKKVSVYQEIWRVVTDKLEWILSTGY